jgi:hypothetical protein
MVKYLGIAIVIMIMTACSSSPIVPFEGANIQEVSYPELGADITKSIGDVMVRKGRIDIRKSLNISHQIQFNKSDGESSIMTCALTVEPQFVYIHGSYETKKIQAECYGSVNFRRTLADGTTSFNCPGTPLVAGDICLKENGEIFLAFLGYRLDLEQDFEYLHFEEQASSGPDNYVEELVFNGLDGENIVFVYKEYDGHATKPIYFQEFNSSLKDGSIVQFKGLKIEVIEVTGTTITYKLMKSF